MKQLDVVGTTGGKATVERHVDGMAKIRLKGGPKQYKSGQAGPSGRDRLQRRVNALVLAAYRLEKKGGPEAPYASRLREVLQQFTALEAQIR